MISQIINQAPERPERMTPAEKIQLIKKMDEKGILNMRGAIREIAEQLRVSVPTVYRYMKKVQSSSAATRKC